MTIKKGPEKRKALKKALLLPLFVYGLCQSGQDKKKGGFLQRDGGCLLKIHSRPHTVALSPKAGPLSVCLPATSAYNPDLH